MQSDNNYLHIIFFLNIIVFFNHLSQLEGLPKNVQYRNELTWTIFIRIIIHKMVYILYIILIRCIQPSNK